MQPPRRIVYAPAVFNSPVEKGPECTFDPIHRRRRPVASTRDLPLHCHHSRQQLLAADRLDVRTPGYPDQFFKASEVAVDGAFCPSAGFEKGQEISNRRFLLTGSLGCRADRLVFSRIRKYGSSSVLLFWLHLLMDSSSSF